MGGVYSFYDIKSSRIKCFELSGKVLIQYFQKKNSCKKITDYNAAAIYLLKFEYPTFIIYWKHFFESPKNKIFIDNFYN